MPIVLPGNRQMTLYPQVGGGYSTVPQADGVVTLSGTGFGSAPNIVVFRTFSEGAAGDPIQETAPTGEIGDITHTGTTGMPLYGEMNGRVGMYNHKVGATAELWLGFTFPLSRRFRAFYNYGIPVGKLHPGSVVTAPLTFSTASDWKPLWLGYDTASFSGAPPNGDDKADLVIPSHIGNGAQSIVGNSVTIGSMWTSPNASQYWKWDDLNSVCYVQECDATAPTATASTQDVYWMNDVVNATKTQARWHKQFTVASFNSAAGAEGVLPDAGAFYGFARLGSFSERSSTDGDNTQVFYADLYIAVESVEGSSDDYWQGVFLSDAATIDDSTVGMWIAPSEWDDSGCTFTYPADRPELTHHHVHKQDRTIVSGAKA